MLLQGPGKKWESYDLNKNGKPVRIPMHVKTGDTVVVIAGKDKGKVGEVSKVRARVCKLAGIYLHMITGPPGQCVCSSCRVDVSIHFRLTQPHMGIAMHKHTL